jgi:uncharacterized membrane protein YdbT with pleckstrin-like domain
MSRYLARMLLVDERVIYASELHWIVYLQGGALVAAGTILGYFGPYVMNEALQHMLGLSMPGRLQVYGVRIDIIKVASLLVIAMGAVELIRALIKQISTELVITTRRVIAKYGFISCNTFELLLTKVEGANVDQTVLGRLLGFGTLLVKGTGGGISPIDHIAQPFKFHSVLMQVVDRARHAKSTEGSAHDD